VLNQQAANLTMRLRLGDVPGLACGGSCLVRSVWDARDFVQAEADPLPVALRSHESAVFAFAPLGRARAGSAEAEEALARVRGRSMLDGLRPSGAETGRVDAAKLPKT